MNTYQKLGYGPRHNQGEQVNGRLTVDDEEVTKEQKFVTAVINKSILNRTEDGFELILNEDNE